MKRMSVFGLDIDIHARRKGETSLSLDDIGVLNDQSVLYMRSLDRSELESRVSGVTVPDLSDLASVNAALEKHGIVVIPDFIDEDSISKVGSAMTALQSKIDEFTRSSEMFREDTTCLVQKGACKVSGYDRLANYGKTVVQIRDGQDAGMVDVFNVDHLFEGFKRIIRPAYENSEISNILGTSTPHHLQAKNLNLYLNSGITKTRGFHVDAYRKKLKSFIYLTDVLSLDDGPYTYVKGSHVDSAYRRINKTLSRHLPIRTETPIVHLESIVPAIARKGTLVISDQGGCHRGFPQKPGHTRMVSVMNYS